jgi:predicted enzyme related to lactoylglutathione lyase
MINFRVDDLNEALKALRDSDAELVEKTEQFAHGRFGWFLDPEGNKVELWQPAVGL